MLLFVRKQYIDQILAGTKRFEIRRGRRYRNITIGDVLVLNSRYRVKVTRVETFETADHLKHLMDPDDLRQCYPDPDQLTITHRPDPFYVFHFARVEPQSPAISAHPPGSTLAHDTKTPR